MAGNDLISLLRERSAVGGGAGYAFLGDGERVSASLTHAELDRAASVLAAKLRALAPASRNVLLAYPPGIEFIVGFFGCLYAGLVPVPVALPHPRKNDERLAAIAADCGAELVLSSSAGCRVLAVLAATDALRGLRIVETDLDTAGESIAAAAAAASEDTAFLQYTSGSTRAPRGVCVSHGNVLANLAAIHAAERNGPHSRGVSWLPAYHDMGLVEGILQPLYGGYPTTLLAHSAFLQRPVRWLQAISRFGATVSGGPNFAFDACVRRVSDADLATLDLRRWEVAYCGAEPVRAETLRAFVARFERCGFRASALRPVYGLAEATLLVSASDAGACAPCTIEADRSALEQGRIDTSSASEAVRTLVSCGRPTPGISIRIVDSETQRALPERQVGEIWVTGASVARGYYGRSVRSAEVFVETTLDGICATWLRTGDLGAMDAGELYVTGRRKDLIIVRGRKLHPQDIEHSVQRLDPHRIAAVAAFGCEGDAGEGVAVLVELRARMRPAADDVDAVWARFADAIRREIYREHDLAPASLAFVPTGALARTSSGKLMRYRCRQNFLLGRVPLLQRFDAPMRVATTEIA